MNKLLLSLSIILGTFAIGVIAIAVAHRDARHHASDVVARPEYSMQEAQPIPYNSPEEESDIGLRDIPAPLSSRSIVRGNDDSRRSGLVQQASAQDLLAAPDLQKNTPSLPSLGDDRSNGLRNPALTNNGMSNNSGMSSVRPTPAGLPTLGDSSPTSARSTLTSAKNGNALPTTQPTNNPVGSNRPNSLGNPSLPNDNPHPNNLPSLQDAGLSQPDSSPLPQLPLQEETSENTEGPAESEDTMPHGAAALTTPTNPSATGNGYPNLPQGTGRSANPTNPQLTNLSLSNPNLGNPAAPLRQGYTPANNIDPNPASSSGYVSNTVSSNTVSNNTPSATSNQYGPNNGLNARGGLSGQVSPNGQGSSNTFLASSAKSTQLVDAAPGQRGLDGAQNPSLQLMKRAPEEVQVGQTATFSLIVRNVGNATAHEVTVFDRIPKGTRLVRMSPEAEQTPEGALTWNLGDLAADAERSITIELVPETEGEIGSVASVTFASQASVRTVSTSPRLEITQLTEPTVHVGDQTIVRVRVANNGTGVAKNVILEAEIPDGLRYTQAPGSSFSVEIGDLAPGQTEVAELELVGTKANVVRNLIRAVAANTTVIESVKEIEVVAPQLTLALSGPKLRYLERQATYQLTVTNGGTAPARNIDIEAFLPRELQFNSAANGGEYLSNQHAITWGLEELKPGEMVSTQLVVLPIATGECVIQLQAQAEGVRAEPTKKQVRVEGQSELSFTIEDDNDPIETDGQTTYTVKVSNIGTREDANVSLAVDFPQGTELISVDAPTRYKSTPSGIVFEAVPEMKAKDVQVYRFTLKLAREGMQVVRASVTSKQRPTPVHKEESTEVYSDH